MKKESVSITDPEVDSLILRLRAERTVLDELNAEYARLLAERRARWDTVGDVTAALKTNPSRETCDAYFALCGHSNVRENEVYGLRRTAIGTTDDLLAQLNELLGIGTRKADYET
jgi:hypothetical protein